MRLKFMSLNSLHLLTDGNDLMDIQRILRQCALLKKLRQRLFVKGIIHNPAEPCLHIWIISVADSLHKQFPKRLIIKGDFTKNIKNLSTERLTFLLQFGKKTLEHHPLTGLVGNKIPEIADLRLSNSVDSAEPLLQPIWIPRQIVIDHEVGSL